MLLQKYSGSATGSRRGSPARRQPALVHLPQERWVRNSPSATVSHRESHGCDQGKCDDTGNVMARVWYVSFHGGDAPHDWNNIHVFDLDGQLVGKALDAHSLPADLELRELRGFAFGPTGDLYVANAYKNASQVLRFAGKPDAEGKHAFREIFVERCPANPGLAHPFEVTFGPDENLYVPSQDTNLVSRYFGPSASQDRSGKPMPLPEALRAIEGKPPPGTFIPSHHHHPAGLRTVRGTIFHPQGDLYVADRDSDSVKRYDRRSGHLVREYQHHHLKTPIHLLTRPSDGALLVGSRDRDSILALDPATGDVKTLVESGAGGLAEPSGMAIGPDGKLYVGSRKSRQILRFDAGSGEADAAPFIDGLKDAPEFVVLVER